MRILLLVLILSAGCTKTIKNPVTYVEYTGYIKQEGIGISVKPHLWEWCVSLYRSFNEEEVEDD